MKTIGAFFAILLILTLEYLRRRCIGRRRHIVLTLSEPHDKP